MLRVGSRAQVMHGNAKMTGGGLKKKDLKYNKQGKIVSKKMSAMAKKEKRLQKAGYTTRKGEFGAIRIMRGGVSLSDLDRTHIKEQLKSTIEKYSKTELVISYLSDDELLNLCVAIGNELKVDFLKSEIREKYFDGHPRNKDLMIKNELPAPVPGVPSRVPAPALGAPGEPHRVRVTAEQGERQSRTQAPAPAPEAQRRTRGQVPVLRPGQQYGRRQVPPPPQPREQFKDLWESAFTYIQQNSLRTNRDLNNWIELMKTYPSNYTVDFEAIWLDAIKKDKIDFKSTFYKLANDKFKKEKISKVVDLWFMNNTTEVDLVDGPKSLSVWREIPGFRYAGWGVSIL